MVHNATQIERGLCSVLVYSLCRIGDEDGGLAAFASIFRPTSTNQRHDLPCDIEELLSDPNCIIG